MNKLIYVLHVVTDMNRGGLETMIMNYYRQINRDVLQFDFLTHREYDGDYGEEIISRGGKIYHLPTLNPFSRSYKNALFAFFREHPKYQIVHVHQDCMSSVVLKEAKKNNVPVRIAHCHSSNQDKNIKYIIKLIYKNSISKYATKLFACSEKAGQWMFNGASFEVLNNAIDSLKYTYNYQKNRDIRIQLGIEEDDIVLGHVGRFYAVKNHIFLLDIINSIKHNRKIKLLLVGDGPLYNSIKEKVKEMKLSDRVIFTGIRSDVSDLMQAMNTFVFPSLYEGLPLTLIEAQASGLPCLISDTIPPDCMITNLVEKKPLSDGAESWANKAIELSQMTRRNTYEEVKSAGFDITENAEKLSDFYIKQWEEKCQH